MPYDETLARRVCAALESPPGVTQRRMFGGLAFMWYGNMCCCVTDRGLMVRVGADAYADALARPYAGLMDLTGRPLTSWVLVAPEGLASAAGLAEWVMRGVEFAATLPRK